MDLLNAFKLNFKEKFTEVNPSCCKLLLAVSGGIDSVVLTDLLYNAGFDFAIAHCNFKLRGEESMRDENFVLQLGKKYKKEVFVKRFDTVVIADKEKMSIQEAARNLRYQWFQEIANSSKLTDDSSQMATQNPVNNQLSTVISHLSSFNYISTAHNADDNIETVMMNFFRGTGISGLHGIPAKQKNIIRPLLFAPRESILKYAKENELTWVEDSSNAEDKYTRNYFRLNLIPELQKIFPQVKNNLLENIERFEDTEILYQQAIESHKSKLLLKKGKEIYIPVLLLKKAQPLRTLIWEIIKPYNFSSSQTEEIIKLLDADNSSYVSSATHRIIKNRKHLVIALLQLNKSDFIVVDKDNTEINFDGGKFFISMKEGDRNISSDNNIAMIDASKISFPLLLRKWKQGDYFYPLGMSKKKKLSRFFIDKKLSALDKENTWVLESDKKIIWVVGQRIDDRFKIKPSTKTIIQLKFQP